MVVAGQASSGSQRYNYVDLIQPPVVTKVYPLSGPTAGGTVVTITGSGYGSVAVVSFEELAANGSLTGVQRECTWLPTELPGTSCNDSVVMCVLGPIALIKRGW